MLALIPCVGPVFAIILAPFLISGLPIVSAGPLVPFSGLLAPLAAAIIF